MPLSESELNPGESIFVDLHPHWAHFVQPVLALLASIVLGIISLRFESGGLMRNVFGWLSIGLIVVGAVWTVARYISWSTSHFVVTDHRIMYRSGWLTKSGIDIPLDRVNNVMIRQRLVERLLGAGDLIIESAGESGQQRFSDISAPGRVQNMVFERIREAEGGTAPVTSTDVADQLERLEAMLRRGTLTRAEFEQQKRRLLG